MTGKHIAALVTAGIVVFGSFCPVQAGMARGGTAMYSAHQTSNFYAGNTYVHFEYGVKEDRAYVAL